MRAGPQAILDGPDETRALIAAAGLESRGAARGAGGAPPFRLRGGALRALPASPPALFKTDCCGSRRQAAPLARAVRRASGSAGTNRCWRSSRAASATRRPSAPRRPRVIGIYAGDAAELSVRSALPRLAAMEREHGSVLRALIAERGGRRARPARLVSRRPRRAAARRWRGARQPAHASRARAIAPIERADAAAGACRPRTARPSTASGSCSRRPPPRRRRCSRRSRPRPPRRCARSRTRPSPSSAWVSAPAPTWAWTSTPTASSSRAAKASRLLGCQYETSMFADRAPEGGVLLRALLGGTFDPALVDADDGAIAARRSATCGASPASRASRTSSTSGARAPAFRNTISAHAARVRAVDDAVARLPGPRRHRQRASRRRRERLHRRRDAPRRGADAARRLGKP